MLYEPLAGFVYQAALSAANAKQLVGRDLPDGVRVSRSIFELRGRPLLQTFFILVVE